jgi:type II secretory pathway component GspD/PulD (secretin)
MTTSPDSERGIGSSTDKAGGNLLAGGGIVIVQDREQTLRTVDRVVAQIDVQPAQLVIAGVIVQLKIAKGKEGTPLIGSADRAGKALTIEGNGSHVTAATR